MAKVIEGAIYMHGAIRVRAARWCGEAKCFMDVT